MDTQTRHALKQDRFVDATASGLDWLQANRTNTTIGAAAVVILAALIIAGSLIYSSRSARAEGLFGQAMDIYSTPLVQPGQPAEPGEKTYPTAAARAKAANPLFVQVADQYSWLKAGDNAEYFAGLTYLDMGQTADAERELHKAAASHDKELAALAKMALAGLYRQTGRENQAVDLYQEIIKSPALTVPAAAAKLQLAGLYETKNPVEAKKLYAEIKDQNKDTAAGQIASQKLSGK
ncbi:MAG TPA: coatomer subunit epsilon [Silvibacterium sp.]|nr:coatomer subunit epsilon [Silvibacterium sp.]